MPTLEPPTSVRFTEEQAEWLDRQAELEERDVSFIVRRLVQNVIDAEEELP